MSDASPQNVEALSQRAHGVLAEALRQHGLAPTPQDGGWWRLGTVPLLARCAVDRFKEQSGTSMIQLTIDVSPDATSQVVIGDTLVGIGESADAALVEAITSWIHGILAPIRAAFGATDSAEELNIYDVAVVNIERDELTMWEAWAGPFQIRGGGDGQDAFAKQLSESPPLMTLLLNPLTDLLADTPDALGWIKLFVSRQPGGGITSECKFINQDWPEGMRQLSAAPWPDLSDGMLFKQFVFLKRGKTEPANGRGGAPAGRRGGCLGVVALTALILFWAVKILTT